MAKEISRRFSGSNVLESLVQGATSRQTMIEANLGAWMKPQVSPETPVISDQDSKILNIWHRLPVPVRIALVGIPLSTAAAACGGAAKGSDNGENPTILPPARTTEASSTRVTPTPTPTERPPTATPDPPKPKPVSLEEAEKILDTGFKPISEADMRKSFELVFDKYPDFQIQSQGITFTRDNLKRPIDNCVNSPSRYNACAGVVRIAYQGYLASGYYELMVWARNTLNYSRTEFTGQARDNFEYALITTLRLNNLVLDK